MALEPADAGQTNRFEQLTQRVGLITLLKRAIGLVLEQHLERILRLDRNGHLVRGGQPRARAPGTRDKPLDAVLDSHRSAALLARQRLRIGGQHVVRDGATGAAQQLDGPRSHADIVGGVESNVLILRSRR